MKTVVTVSYIFTLFRLSWAILDFEELKTFNYGIDIRNEPIILKKEKEVGDLNAVQITSIYGQPYQCSFPNAVEQEKQKEEAEKIAMETGIPDLLSPMESGPCLKKTKDWWTYEFCYGKHIKQFHVSDEGRIEGETVLLGLYESEQDWEDKKDKNEPSNKQSRLYRYHTQQYVNGSKCDLNGRLRQTEVRFMCQEGSVDYISRLDEPETCKYVMSIHTMKICYHPFLKSPSPTKFVTITCNPLLTVIQYQEYLDEMEAKEELKKLEQIKKEEEETKIAEEKAKYYKQYQFVEGGLSNEDVQIEDEGKELKEVEHTLKDMENEIFDDELSHMFQAATGDGQFGTKTLVKMVTSPDDLKDFLKEAMDELKQLQTQSQDQGSETVAVEKGEINEGTNIDKVEIPKKEVKNNIKPISEQSADTEQEVLDDPELEELDLEIKTLREKYRNKKERLTDIKQKVKSSMKEHYSSIIKEAQAELEQEGIQTDVESQESRAAVKQLTQTIENLLNKLDKTATEFSADKVLKQSEMEKELKQSEEYVADEKYLETTYAAKDDNLPMKLAQGPIKADEDRDRVKVRVSRIKSGEKNIVAGEIRSRHTEELERSVQKELDKSGLGNGEKIQVKIISAGLYDGNDDTMHVLSEEETETFKNMIINIILGTSEAEKEQAKHSQLEENYSFVWDKNRHTHTHRPEQSQTSDSSVMSNPNTNSETKKILIPEDEDS